MWQSFLKNNKLSLTDIHVWKTNLDISPTLQNDLWELLSEEEKLRADRFRFPHLRVHFIAARGTLRRLLAQYLSIPAADIKLEYGKQGKPYLANNPEFNFNLSHSEDLAVFAFAKNMTLGIDIEFIRQKIDMDLIAPNFFSKNEVEAFFNAPQEERIQVFFNCWTRKEAFIKAKGGGLSIPLDQFEVTLLPKEMPQIVAINWAPQEVKKWSTFSFKIGKDYIGALMTEGNVKKVSYFDFRE